MPSSPESKKSEKDSVPYGPNVLPYLYRMGADDDEARITHGQHAGVVCAHHHRLVDGKCVGMKHHRQPLPGNLTHGRNEVWECIRRDTHGSQAARACRAQDGSAGRGAMTRVTTSITQAARTVTQEESLYRAT